jgi:ATP-dependent protease ClpP protease subunit
MKVPTGLLAATLLLAGANTSLAEVRIAGDQGGQIGRYVDQYEQLRSSGQRIVIDGLCASACTIILAAIPHDKICVTPNANLAFHAAWDFGADGRTIANRGATRTLYSMYPSQVRHWIDSHGGLSPRMIFLRGRQLEAMYRPCY